MTAPGPRVFVIDGEIAAGKSALAQALAAGLAARGLKVGVIAEPVDEWCKAGILQKFYGDPVRYAYEFQTYVFATRTLAAVEAFEKTPDADVWLSERSPATDLIFMELHRDKIDDMYMQMYEKWCTAWEKILPFGPADVQVLYLQTSLTQCMDRLRGRAREGETGGGVSLEYQSRLRRAHEAYFLGKHPGEFPRMPPCPYPAVTAVDPDLADADFREGGADRARVVEALIGLMGV